MTDWVIVLVPLLVLPIVLLFRFVGCGFDGVATGERDIPLPPRTPEHPPSTTPTPTPTPIYVTPPRYRDYIMGEPNNPGTVKNQSIVPSAANVMGYWRLIEAAGIKIARDEKGLRE